MPLDEFSNQVVQQLNHLQANAWYYPPPHWMTNTQPWVRIYRSQWLQHILSRTLRQADRNGCYPPLWFQIGCKTKRQGHNGAHPFDIYVPIDETGLYSPTAQYVQIPHQPGRFLPQDDPFLPLLQHLSDHYLENQEQWLTNVTNAINEYIHERYYLNRHGRYVLPYYTRRPRKRLDIGHVTVNHANEDDVNQCVQFIRARAETLQAVFNHH